DELKDLAQPARGDRRLELAAKGRPSLVRTDEETEQIGSAERGDGGDEVELSLPARQASRQHDDRPVIGQTPARRELDEALGRDALRIEAPEVDAAMDDAQPVGPNAIDGSGVPGDKVRDGDDALTAAHHRVVPAAQPR